MAKKKRLEKQLDEEATLFEDSLQRIHTVADLAKFLAKLDPEEPIFMFSDEEGNQVNKILGLDLHKEGLTVIPWEHWEREMGLLERDKDG
jgi:hypothetical protein